MSTKVIIDSTAYVGIDTIEVGGKVLTLESAGGSGTGQEGQAIYLEDLPTEDIVDNTLYYIGREAQEIGTVTGDRNTEIFTYSRPEDVYRTLDFSKVDFGEYGVKLVNNLSSSYSRSTIRMLLDHGFYVTIKNIPQLENKVFMYRFGNNPDSVFNSKSFDAPVFQEETNSDSVGTNIIFYLTQDGKNMMEEYGYDAQDLLINNWYLVNTLQETALTKIDVQYIEFSINQSWSMVYLSNAANIFTRMLPYFIANGFTNYERYIHFDNEWAYLGRYDESYQSYLDSLVNSVLKEASDGVY